jgi:hypothetical protein
LEVPHFLRIAALREGREADEIGEEDAHDPSLGDRVEATLRGWTAGGSRGAWDSLRGNGSAARAGHRRRTLGAELGGR